MAKCKTCGDYYRKSPYNNTAECDNCIDQVDRPYLDEEDTLEVQHLVCPSGKTPAVYYD